jgi:hypothetical protein
MRKLIVFANTGYAGEELVDAFVVDHSTTETEIREIAWGIAVDNAESYGHYIGDEDEEGDVYESDMVDAYWEDYDPEKHDDLRSGGGSFEEDF